MFGGIEDGILSFGFGTSFVLVTSLPLYLGIILPSKSLED